MYRPFRIHRLTRLITRRYIQTVNQVPTHKFPQTPLTMAQEKELSQLFKTMQLSPVELYPGANPIQNPLDLFRSYITNKLAEISGVSKDIIYPALERSNQAERGDLVVPVARFRLKGDPSKFADEWAEKFECGELIQKVTSAKGFLQFFLKPNMASKIVLSDVLKRRNDYGSSTVGNGKRVVIEFSSPNIAKPFHAGHLRSTIIGGYLSHLHEKLGYDVVKVNYLGDWGKQFGILAVGYQRYGDAKELETNPIDHLFHVYVKVNEIIRKEKEANDGASATDDEARVYFKKMEDGDKDALKLWQKFRDYSIEKYTETYGRLNIKYDKYRGESLVPDSAMEKAEELFEEKKLLTDDEGAKLVDLRPYSKKLAKAIVKKKDGTSLYLTRDVGEAIARYDEYKFDKSIYVIASQQDLHTAQFFKILELMGFEWAKDLKHINFGMVQGMSTRAGTVVFLDKILNETKEKMHQVMKRNETKYAQIPDPDRVADLVGIAAVMIQDMQAKRINNYAFDWERMFSFEGDTGPYLQYAHARLCSMERKAAEQGVTLDDVDSINFELLTEQVTVDLVRVLSQFPDVLMMALKAMEPSTVVTYLFKLTHLVSSSYDVLWVAGQEKELATARLALYVASRQVLYNGMVILGLTPVERM